VTDADLSPLRGCSAALRMIPQNPIQGVITALYCAHGDGGVAQVVELLDRHICAVHFTVIVPPGVEGHHPVDDAARQVAVSVVEVAGLPGHRGGCGCGAGLLGGVLGQRRANRGSGPRPSSAPHLRLAVTQRGLPDHLHSGVFRPQEAEYHYDLRPRLRPDSGGRLLRRDEPGRAAHGDWGATKTAERNPTRRKSC